MTSALWVVVVCGVVCCEGQRAAIEVGLDGLVDLVEQVRTISVPGFVAGTHSGRAAAHFRANVCVCLCVSLCWSCMAFQS